MGYENIDNAITKMNTPRQAMHVQCNIETRSPNHSAVETTIHSVSLSYMSL
jgi:hypothetical protein